MTNSPESEMHARAVAEATQMSKTGNLKEPPDALKDIPCAAATWRRLVGIHSKADGTLFVALDLNVLVNYCLAEEELNELNKEREEVMALLDPSNTPAQVLEATIKLQGLTAHIATQQKSISVLSRSLILIPVGRVGAAPADK